MHIQNDDNMMQRKKERSSFYDLDADQGENDDDPALEREVNRGNIKADRGNGSPVQKADHKIIKTRRNKQC
jgi:hypothetical protein